MLFVFLLLICVLNFVIEVYINRSKRKLQQHICSLKRIATSLKNEAANKASPATFSKSAKLEQWPDFGCEGIKVQRAHQPTSQCQGKKKNEAANKASPATFSKSAKLERKALNVEKEINQHEISLHNLNQGFVGRCVLIGKLILWGMALLSWKTNIGYIHSSNLGIWGSILQIPMLEYSEFIQVRALPWLFVIDQATRAIYQRVSVQI
eukprot:TRINITY_DN17937_c0_g1_i1.p2 TRINITY_DN17937_c0_g1~~TRINITY_DN17937_c0_g1_i1.p2  ORF type:complete len:223 (+),score=33.41 TRINITY_DN17937_c0_g1_i1:48-671(+)